MTEPIGPSEGTRVLTAAVYDKTPESWGAIGDQVLQMTEEGVGWAEDTPILGQTDNDVPYANVEAAFQSPDSTAVLLQDQQGKLIGYTLAFPFEKMDPETARTKPKAAYLYFTIVEKDHRGQGLVGQVTDPLFEALAAQGYEKVVRDSKIDNGYAAKIARHYGDSIDEAIDHEYWPEVGRETRFTIDIAKYLQRQQASAQ